MALKEYTKKNYSELSNQRGNGRNNYWSCEKKPLTQGMKLQSFDLRSLLNQCNVPEFAKYLWTQSVVDCHLVKCKVHHVELYTLYFGWQTPSWGSTHPVFHLHFVHLGCKNHWVIELALLTRQWSWYPPMNFQLRLFRVDTANFSNQKWVSIWILRRNKARVWGLQDLWKQSKGKQTKPVLRQRTITKLVGMIFGKFKITWASNLKARLIALSMVALSIIATSSVVYSRTFN